MCGEIWLLEEEVSRCSKRKSLRCLCTLVGWLRLDQSSDITSTVCSFCLEFKMKLCWACRAVSVLMAMNTIDDSIFLEVGVRLLKRNR